MLWAKYPDDEDILELGLREYIAYFFKWDPNTQTEKMVKLYNWKQSEKPFERTYRRISNLDDRYENHILKFGNLDMVVVRIMRLN